MTQNVTTLRAIVEGLLGYGKISILGITGQAGAGKSTVVASRVTRIAEQNNFPVARLELDYFFKLSSRARRDWIAEGEKISKAEGDFRKDQVNWWDFAKTEAVLQSLKEGKQVSLSNVYNRNDNGELTGEVKIEPAEIGMLIIFEGVAVCHLKLIDALIYVHAPSSVRSNRIFARDRARRSKEENMRRFMLTESFEARYFRTYWNRIQYFLDNSIGIDEGREDELKILQPMRYEDIFSNVFLD